MLTRTKLSPLLTNRVATPPVNSLTLSTTDFGFDSSDDVFGGGEDPNGGFNRRVKEGPEKRLSRMVEISEERAAKILRKWAVDRAA